MPGGARSHVPQADGFTGAGQSPTVGTEHQTGNLIHMALRQSMPEGTCAHVPQMNGTNLTGADQSPAIGTERYIPEPIRMARRQGMPEGACAHVP